MAANRVTCRLYWRRTFEATEDTNLDVNDEKFLRQTLERMVLDKRRTLKVDLSEFSMTVHQPGKLAVLKRVGVESSGATRVSR
jgi:hypothetical protein